MVNTADSSAFPEGAQEAEFIFLQENDEITLFAIESAIANLTVDTANGGTIEGEGSFLINAVAASGDGGLFLTNPDPFVGAGFSYQTYGTWAQATGAIDEADLGVISVGARTDVGDIIPNGPFVSFVGIADGYVVRSGEVSFVIADVNIETDFSTLTIRTTETFERPLDGSLTANSDLNLTGSGDVTGNGFAGPVSTTGGGSGRFDGFFYGPGAAEAGGTWRTTTGDGGDYIGAFGVSQP